MAVRMHIPPGYPYGVAWYGVAWHRRPWYGIYRCGRCLWTPCLRACMCVTACMCACPDGWLGGRVAAPCVVVCMHGCAYACVPDCMHVCMYAPRCGRHAMDACRPVSLPWQSVCFYCMYVSISAWQYAMWCVVARQHVCMHGTLYACMYVCMYLYFAIVHACPSIVTVCVPACLTGPPVWPDVRICVCACPSVCAVFA